MMKISSKGHHPVSVSTTDAKSKRGIVSKQNFKLREIQELRPKHIEVLNRIKERIKIGGGRGMSEISRIVTEEMLRDVLSPKMSEKKFQKIVDRISVTVQDDPVLSNFIKKIMLKLT